MDKVAAEQTDSPCADLIAEGWRFDYSHQSHCVHSTNPHGSRQVVVRVFQPLANRAAVGQAIADALNGGPDSVRGLP